MATTRINELSEQTAPASLDLLVTEDVDDSNNTKKITMESLISGRVPVRTNANRGAAGTPGRVIFNSDDGQLNIDDGTNWTLPDGTTT